MDFTIDIARPPAEVFAALADLPNYGRWLPPSSVYAGSTEVSALPIALGTKYTERSKLAPLHGSITQFEPPHALAFQQATRTPLGRLMIDIDYRLEALDTGAGTRVLRTTTPRFTGALALLGPMITRTIRQENLRTLARLKGYLEAPSPAT